MLGFPGLLDFSDSSGRTAKPLAMGFRATSRTRRPAGQGWKHRLRRRYIRITKTLGRSRFTTASPGVRPGQNNLYLLL